MESAGVSRQSPGFAASGVVTLTTDFGLKDPFVGVMKGRLVTHFPQVRIIDLTHEIPAHWPAEAGFWLARSFRYFPRGTVHVAVVDPGVGSAREIAAVEAEGHLFLAPDNGLLAAVFEAAESVTARHVAEPLLARLGIDARAPPSTVATSSRRWRPSWPRGACSRRTSANRPMTWCQAGSRSRWSGPGAGDGDRRDRSTISAT
jgi:hypothetical protein